MIVVSHASRLIAAPEDAAAQVDDLTLQPIVPEKRLGETHIANLDMSAMPPWQWPAR